MSKQPLIEQLNDAISRILAHPDVELSPSDASLADLLQAARDLRGLPRPDFKGRLKADLERRISMSTKTIMFRPGFRTVTPYVLPSSADFVSFLKNVFGGVETEHTVTSPTSFHAEVRIGDSMLMIGVGSGRSMPTSLFAYVPNVDDVYKRALDAGCIELEPLHDDYGDRFGCVQDPFGNGWTIATHLGASYVRENHHDLTLAFSTTEANRFMEFLKRAVTAQELQRYEWPGGLYATMRIGDSVVSVSEAANHEWMRPMPTMVYLYVPDCDAIYDQAIRAGAKPIHPPINQPYGDRNGGVTDEWGNQWYMATPL
jgi:PhnB protein